MNKTSESSSTMKKTLAKTILVTGASTGIGWATSLELAEKGWRVFAAVRKEADAKKLRDASSGKITTVIMDIVDYESVKRGARRDRKSPRRRRPGRALQQRGDLGPGAIGNNTHRTI